MGVGVPLIPFSFPTADITAGCPLIHDDTAGSRTLIGGQALRTTDSPTFAGVTLGALAGVLKATAGAVAGSATCDDLSDGATYVRTHYDFTATYQGYLNQSVQTGASPTFVGVTLSGRTTGQVLYTTTSGAVTSGTALLFDGTSLSIGGSAVNPLTVWGAVYIRKDQNAGTAVTIVNATNGAAASAQLSIQAGTTTNACSGFFGAFGASYSAVPIYTDCFVFGLNSDATALILAAIGAAQYIDCYTGGSATTNRRLHVSALGNIVVGNAALATNATDGFLYIPTCAGTPTGTPTAYTGMVPLVMDTTNHKLYAYEGGAWKGGTAPGAWS